MARFLIESLLMQVDDEFSVLGGRPSGDKELNLTVLCESVGPLQLEHDITNEVDYVSKVILVPVCLPFMLYSSIVNPALAGGLGLGPSLALPLGRGESYRRKP